MFKLFVALLLLAVLGSLASGLYYVLHDRAAGRRAVQALTWRIALSLGVFAVLLAGRHYHLLGG